ncbi:acyl-CoA dehydrogenase family protein [Actinomadura sp. B10D3]|uniref:acyl-CoA dehydrogenase family protein n=1 Tax=Actinomadura sp. B10D3 TaxID=3153557 RepID=UPI00325CDAFE
MKRSIFSADHEEFRGTVKTFVQREIAPRQEECRSERRIPREVWLGAGEQGFLGLPVPARYGGGEADDYRFHVVLAEELAGAALAFASSVGIHTDVVAPYLIELTSEEQRERWLPRFCSGDTVTAIAMTEPGAGSDLAALRTRAVRDGSSGWRLTGSKIFVTNGYHADLVLVAARTGDGRRDISLFAVESGAEGFTRGRKLDKVGQPESDTAELFFEDVPLTDGNLVGPLHGGFRAMMDRLPQERLNSAVINVAHAAAALEATLAYAAGRTAFGAPIGSFQYNRFLLAELVTKVDVARAFVDRCVEAHLQGSLSGVDAAKAKWWSAQTQNEVIDACVQMHGGYGYMREYEVARAWLDARVTRIWAGSNEIMKEIIGRDLGFGAPAKHR